MHTIAGLLQLEAYQEALDLVINEASGYQQLIRSLAEAVQIQSLPVSFWVNTIKPVN